MILIKFKEVPETRVGFSCLAFRWTFQPFKWGAAFVHQYQLKDDGKWYDSHTMVYGVSLEKCWAWGFSHVYYDGPHCGFSLGWLQLTWHNERCKHCHTAYPA